ncbi:MAG: hypothetical protein ACD_28C00030G0001, partial [uncultured bacterium]
AAIVIEGKKEKILSGHDLYTTNNRMEILAVAEGLREIKKKNPTAQVAIFSDSSLVIKTMSQGWKRKVNLDVWARLDEAKTGLRCRWNWVKGHANDPLNERCDKLAVKESEKAQALLAKEEKSPTREDKMEAIDSNGALFVCGQCKKKSEGKLGLLLDSGLIRVDCPHCGKYIKFAPPTLENRKRAQARQLLSKKELEHLEKEQVRRGKTLHENELKILKAMTWEEATDHLNGPPALF